MTDQQLVQRMSEVLDAHDYKVSGLKPSEYIEKNRVMDKPFPGPYRFDRTPYLREPLDRLDPRDPARIVAFMKGAQLGMTAGLIENGIAYVIAENPGNILYLTADMEILKENMTGRVDPMLDSCGLRSLIGPTTMKRKNMETGDTSTSKKYPGGMLVGGAFGSPSKFRNRSMQFGFIDEIDSAPRHHARAGSVQKLIETRFAAYYDKMKLYYLSTPELKDSSNIEPAFLAGDQRYYYVPCPCCGEYITLEWSVRIDDQNLAGITWKTDWKGNFVDGSVCYVCQKCGGDFKDSYKYDMNNAGEWRATAEATMPHYHSYHLNSLYAPAGMYDWDYYARAYHDIFKSKKIDYKALQTFKNTVLGQTFESKADKADASKISRNIREYDINTVPCNLSEKDGNGRIVMITCAADMNGKVDDARLDWEAVAWSENESSYSIAHGSIGTFERDKKNENREILTYNHGTKNSVWPIFEQVIKKVYATDDGREMGVFVTGLDTGYYTNYAYRFIDSVKNAFVIGIKGDDPKKTHNPEADKKPFKKSVEKSNLYIVYHNHVKDKLSEYMTLELDEEGGEQPPGFMNYPEPAEGMYTLKGFFDQYEQERRVANEDKNGKVTGTRWVKIGRGNNHFWDCRVYNMACKDILAELICKERGIKYPDWSTYCNLVRG